MSQQQILSIFFTSLALAVGLAIGNWRNKRYGTNRKEGAVLLGGMALLSLVVGMALVLGF